MGESESLLIREAHGFGTISSRAFWARRWLRLLPALLVVLAAFSAHALLGGSVRTASGEEPAPLVSMGWVAGALFHFTNWSQAFGRESPAELGHLWSLAVEEHLYILWPAVLVLVWSLGGRARTVLTVAIAGAIGSVVLAAAIMATRGSSTSSWSFIYYATPTRIGGMLGGAALAAAWSLRPAASGWTGRPRWRWTCRAAVAAFVTLALGTRIE